MGHSPLVKDIYSCSDTNRARHPRSPWETVLRAASSSANSITVVPENSPDLTSETCIYMNFGRPTVSMHSFFRCASVSEDERPETITMHEAGCGPVTAADSGGGPTNTRDTKA